MGDTCNTVGPSMFNGYTTPLPAGRGIVPEGWDLRLSSDGTIDRLFIDNPQRFFTGA